MQDMIIVKTDGIQKGKLNAPPLPFSFENEVLSGGGLNQDLFNFLLNLSFRDMFPDDVSAALFKWNDLMPHEAITYVSIYHTMNEAINKSAIKEGRPILPITDRQISERRAKVGVLTPREIETRYAPGITRPIF
jgi:hypothetical protein